jgi:hypothetical protein
MNSILKYFLPWSVKEYFRSIQRRIANLELVCDTLIESPKYIASENKSFNGQQFRIRIFKDLIEAIQFKAIIETGTCLGNTTGFMAETSKLPVYSSECDPRFHALAKKRLTGYSAITLELADSRRFLTNMAHSEIGNPVFCYLDAHWYGDLPLRAEIEIIARYWKSFVIMIDDFQVPNEPGYGYDIYDTTRILSLDYIEDLLRDNNLLGFFPSAASSEETGARRGCIVITRNDEIGEKLYNLKSLASSTNQSMCCSNRA